jgi:hypothetical protein
VQKRARTTIASTTSRRTPSSQDVISRRCLHSTAQVAQDSGRGKKEEPRFNFNTSLYFTEDPDPDVSDPRPFSSYPSLSCSMLGTAGRDPTVS